MEPVELYATVVAKAGKADEVCSVVDHLTTESRKESGCLTYNPYRVKDSENTVVIIEKWESPEHLETHNKTSHYLECVGKLKDLSDSIEVTHLSKL
ncbi:putative monooxygenase YcnE [Gracilariopsis chorda]|uniref:Putative monooxygenase YcnE n=1 Tax=Gracilariopsis chorda TaxID=448386 RepID=A0A2V3J726_9FLOR|nr:putative monooxygenase YcnE [Gracilariopsis chorda]|eukprot:PXF49787.1 putative monooxygenase YcnE [Gracilariopsis chorda]